MTDDKTHSPRRRGRANGFHGRALDRLLGHIRAGELTVTRPDGRALTAAGAHPGPRAHWRLWRWRGLWRLATGGAMGLAEGYLAGDWDSPDLTALLRLGLANEPPGGGRGRILMPRHWRDRLARARHANTRRGARRNIAAHYDLGNAFYRAWLDPSLTYSAALYDSPGHSLAAAQHAKLARVAALAEIGPRDRVLEIGCGWGSFMEYAAGALGARIDGLTLSPAQHQLCRARLATAGLEDQAAAHLTDYRDAGGRYDRIVSIEMIEAVGAAHWPIYFRAMHDRLSPGGRAAIQAITIGDRHFDGYRRGVDFIQRHIFPGGMLPCPAEIDRQARRAGLAVRHAGSFGPSYARTLAAWRENFLAAWPQITAMPGFDARFKRLWLYYLAYCQAGFEAGRVDVGHWVLARPA